MLKDNSIVPDGHPQSKEPKANYKSFYMLEAHHKVF